VRNKHNMKKVYTPANTNLSLIGSTGVFTNEPIIASYLKLKKDDRLKLRILGPNLAWNVFQNSVRTRTIRRGPI